MEKWNINIHDCPNNIVEIKKFAKEKFRKCIWSKQNGRKKVYYIKEFNPTRAHEEKEYIRTNIKWKAKMFITQLRMGSHHLRCKTSR